MLLGWADELLSKMLDGWVEWSGWGGFHLDCQDYQSTCGAKNDIFLYILKTVISQRKTLKRLKIRINFMQHYSKLPSTLSECSVIWPDDSLFAIVSHSILQGTFPSQFSVALALLSSITRKLWQTYKLNYKLSVERFFCSFIHVTLAWSWFRKI